MLHKAIHSILGTAIVSLVSISHVGAEEILLNNGDRVSGTIVEQTDQTVTVQTQAMGKVVINREFIKPEKETPPESEKFPQWARKASLGYSQAKGNTRKSQFNGKIDLHKKMERAEFNAKVTSFISTSNNREDARKYYGLLRYAYSFGEQYKWYHFYKLEGKQDRFANIDYRITPSSGLGYWFSDKDSFKLMGELAFGFEHTNYRFNRQNENEPVAVPRAYLEKLFTNKLRFSEDITLYPSLSELGDYRLRSETAIAHPINDRLSVKLSFIDDYDSDPGGSTKKNDYRLISSMEINF